MAARERRSIARLAADSGVAVSCAGNLPIDLDDAQYAWFVEEGAVDVFLLERNEGVQQTAPQHVLRADAGRLVPGVTPQEGETTFSLLAKGLPGTVLRRLPVDSLAVVSNRELADQMDSWLMDVSTMLTRDVMNQPRPDAVVSPGESLTLDSGTVAARRGVAWASRPPAGAALFMGLIDPADSGCGHGGAIPLTPESWITLLEPALLDARSSRELAGEGILLSALTDFHAMALSLERLNRRLAAVDQANLERARVSNRRRDEEGARRNLFNLYGLLEPELTESRDSGLLAAMEIVGQHEGIDFRWPAQIDESGSPLALADVLDASGVRGRRVRLAREENWWIGDSGALLAYRADDGRPVALLPGLLGRYREVDPVTGRATSITAEGARQYRANAWVFYQPLPSTGVGAGELLRLARKGLSIDFARFLIAGLLGGLVLLLPAVILGIVADTIIPSGETGLLYLATASLAAFAVLGGLLHVLQGMALMRLEGRAASRVEAAFWDRLLRLPPKILQRYPAGDLAMRGMTFQNLRDTIQGVVANAVLSIVFLSPAIVLIFLHDLALGVATTVFGVAALVVTTALGLKQIAPHRHMIHAFQRLAGSLFEFIGGISKLRVDHAEGSAFAVWAQGYRDQKRAELKLGGFEAHLLAFGAALPLLGGALLFLAAARADGAELPVGGFLAVYALFMLFLSAVTRLGSSFNAIAAILPAFDQVQPFLSASPEISVDGERVEHLGGDVLFDHVTFQYDPDGPVILDDVSIHARPGEFVAIAGESGAGKSTLFRLALGLDQPLSGAVYYDGRDLKHLNVKQVRRLIGSVPQEIQLQPQDLWDNIVGGHDDATADEAWAAAKKAGVDRVISAMPMGMLTPVGTSASVTSGGESQRIMIARALIASPGILLLDEATNWLDNDSQAQVMSSLAKLSSTRIVIAHRLSTLRFADRIFVMQAGRVVQEGSFEELVAVEGVFQGLVRRQMA